MEHEKRSRPEEICEYDGYVLTYEGNPEKINERLKAAEHLKAALIKQLEEKYGK